MADAELANNLKKLTKVGKKDQVHSGQLTYVHWINCVNDSRSIIRQYGLMPEVKKRDELKKMFPPMSVIYDHFEARDTGLTKQACNAVTQHFFRTPFVTNAVKRTLTRQAFYRKRSSLLIYHKLMHAWALRTLHPSNRNTAFLTAGVYNGCKTKPTDFRDSLWYRNGEGTDNERLVHKFNLFQLTSNSVFLSPLSSAAHLFKTKSSHADDNKQRRKLGMNVKKWKDSSREGVYVAMPPEKGEVGDDNEDDRSVVGKENEKDESKAFTKKSFRGPMVKLGKELDKCNKLLIKGGKGNLLSDVLIKYNRIQKMVGHGLFFDKTKDDKEEEEGEDEGEEGSDFKEEENEESGSTDSSSSSETSSGSETSEEDDDDESEEEHGSQGSDNDGSQNSDGESNADDGNNRKNDRQDEDDVITSVIDDNNERSEVDNDDDHDDDDDDGKDCAGKKDVLAALTKYIKELNGEVTSGAMTGDKIGEALGLKTPPNLRSRIERAYFCSLKSDKMEYIKQLYKGKLSCEAVIPEIDWLSPLVNLMQDLNWSDSIDQLPEGKTIEDEKVILLWNAGDEFVETFM